MKYEYKNGIRNPKTIARQAHEKMRKKAQQGMHPFQRKDVRDKIRQSQQTVEYKLKASLVKLGSKNGMYGRTGSNHPQWKGGKIWWRGKDWDELKLEIRRRDSFQCQVCEMAEEEHLIKYKQPLHVHHIVDYRISKDNSPENLITLCVSHHGKANNNNDYLHLDCDCQGIIMRDPKRIIKVLKYIEKIWKKNPDLRLMQLLLNCRTQYYTEDNDLLDLLAIYYQE